jgi:Pectate lyase superfamily protein/Periplasmic copper-binding protein (NosD)
MNRRGFLKKIGIVTAGTALIPASSAFGGSSIFTSQNSSSNTQTPSSPGPVSPTQMAGSMINVQDYGAVGDGIHDDTKAIRKAIAATTSKRGGGVFFPQPKNAYRITDTIVINRPSVSLVGEFKPGQNESDYYGYMGTVILCDCPNKTAFVFGKLSKIRHSGFQIQSLGFIASKKSVSMIKMRGEDSWVIKDCVFRGGKIALRIKMKLDNASNLVDNCSFMNQKVCGIYDQGFGTEIRGGKFLVRGTGIYLAPASQHTRISNVMFDNGIGIECYGGTHHISNCKFEKAVTGIIIDGDKNLYFMSGRGNRIFGNTFHNDTGSGQGILIESGARNTRIFGPHFVYIGKTITDRGQDTQIIG